MIEFKIPDMSCGHCASVIAKTVRQADPQAKVEVDVQTKTVRIESGEDCHSLAEALAEAGYPAA